MAGCVALLLLERCLQGCDCGRGLVGRVGVLLHQVLHHAHALVEGLAHVGHLFLQLLHLSLELDHLLARAIGWGYGQPQGGREGESLENGLRDSLCCHRPFLFVCLKYPTGNRARAVDSTISLCRRIGPDTGYSRVSPAFSLGPAVVPSLKGHLFVCSSNPGLTSGAIGYRRCVCPKSAGLSKFVDMPLADE